MRGGLDDALDKLARRDELRRRASGEAPSATPPAVNELVEAIAAVVARHPELGVSVGVEGAGDPLLLHFYLSEGQVQVNAENAAVLAPDESGPRHADFDLEADDTAERPYSATPYSAAPAPAADPVGGDTRRMSQDDQDRFGPSTFGYPTSPASPAAERYPASPASPAAERYYAESDTAERRYGSFDSPPADASDPRYPTRDPGESSRDLGARLRDLGMASNGQPMTYTPHPYAATPPPPVPPSAADAATRRIHPEQHRPPAEASAAERSAQARGPVPEQRGMPTPLPQPIPLQVERPEETEMAARRLAALLRDDPSLLDGPRG
ncbi:hypothetical protein [Paractinoplanes lichenicola]|uniref:Uncharacterized protein n=1 Tax=Paractinoplanes lichenicola TaxID=2802976 RepID=A0ABS1W525_9ACTN|nr:hypothetical protein [Actinoplanes lichenicola]MBL7261827.1 hypothetical protein [Actinoplanes lichenicola]